MNFISYFTTFKRLLKKILHIRIFYCTFVLALEGVAEIVLLPSISMTIIMSWIILVLAGLCEVGFAFCLGKTKGLGGLPYWE